MKSKKNINTILSKTLQFLAFTIVLSLAIISCSTDETQTVAQFQTLVMQDEFEVQHEMHPTMLDTTVWSFNTGRGSNGDGWGNNELQYYTDRIENVKVENGMLLITAKEEDYEGASYTSARLLTQGKFSQKYGRFEARMRLPYGQGMWPAFWLLGDDIDTIGWPNCGEIDIMEYRGQEPTLIHGSVHGPGYSAGNAITKSYDLENNRFDTGFHVFGIEWGPNYINYYVDDVLYNQITPEDVTGEWVFNKPFFIIINLAVGGNYVGAPNANTVFPQTMLIDYVRVYASDYTD